MRKRKWIFITIVFLFMGWLVYHFTWDTQAVSKGSVFKSIDSPNGSYTANAYHGLDDATVDFSVVVEIEDKKTGAKKNIYFEYHCEDAEIKWISDSVIQINKKTLNIHNDVYDFRHE